VGGCWHIACFRTTEERAVSRRVLILPQPRYSCQQHWRGVPPIGRGISCNDDPDGGLDAGGDITARVSLTPANQPLPYEVGFMLAG
jgi:hypothetical protein